MIKKKNSWESSIEKNCGIYWHAQQVTESSKIKSTNLEDSQQKKKSIQ